MEKKGAINQYMPYAGGELRYSEQAKGHLYVPNRRPPGDPVFTINLAAGVTPFIRHFGGKEYASQCYRLTAAPVVTYANYRPHSTKFNTLDEWSQEHVLNGGLLCDPLDEAIAHQLGQDPVEPGWEYEQFQAWCLSYYGRRLPPAPTPKGKTDGQRPQEARDEAGRAAEAQAGEEAKPGPADGPQP